MHGDPSPSPTTTEDEKQALAERVGTAMFARDAASQMLGMQIEAMGPGYARLAMRVREDMVNGHRICHGGLIFSLADSAFAFACNSGNQNTVAAACNVDFLRPAFAGDRLVAEAEERSRSERTGIYDITVCNQKSDIIVLFRGKSHQIRGEVLEDLQVDRGC